MRRILIVFLFVVSLFWAFSCDSSNNTDGNDSSINIVNVTAKPLLESVYGEIDPILIKTTAGANDFAFRLSANLAEDNRGGNFVFSPYSVWLPLAALVNATDTQYKDALLTALGASGITQDDINKAASRMLYDLTNVQDQGEEWHYNPLKIVNAIFIDKKFTIQKDFAQVYMDFYRGSSINVDFSSHDAADAVNRWASKNTNGLITDLIKKFDPTTVAAIANAIYFSDRWDGEFNPQRTKEDVFYAPTGNTQAFYMLRECINQLYYEDDRVQAIPLSFKHDGRLFILLPKTGTAEELLSSMTNDYFIEILQNSFRAKGKLLLPRFSIENEIKGLKESLKTLGVPLFEGEPLTNLIEGNLLLITGVMQKAVIKVDEKGTTAAAVTVLTGDGASFNPQQPNVPFEMICNKPFIFILCDYTYGGCQILFTGIVNQP
jgi:serpin B